MAETPDTAEALRLARIADWGEYVAITPIDVDGARAFNVGDPVPKSHVDRGLVSSESVARRSTKAAQAVTGEG